MSNNITIIGLGEIGSSIAIALKAQGEEFFIIGSDRQKFAERRAEENHCVDRIEHNLFDAIQDSDVIILAIPADQTRKMLELIGQDLKDSAIVMDCCPDKTAAVGWARQFMSHPDQFLGIWAGINPEYLSTPSDGGKTAAADLFKGSALYIAPEPQTSEDAIKAASSLAQLLEMECAFTDPMELDGLIAASYHLPLVAAGGLMRCLSSRTGWGDGKKAMGKLFYSMTSPITVKVDEDDPGASLLNNRENTVRLLDDYIRTLKEYRDTLQKKDEIELRAMLDTDAKNLEQWEKDYRRSNQSASAPAESIKTSSAEVMTQTFFGGLLRKKKN